MDWHYSAGGQPAGPVSDNQLQGLLREGKVTAETMVWREGLADWQPAGSVSELSGIFKGGAGVPPPPGAPAARAPSGSGEAVSTLSAGAERARPMALNKCSECGKEVSTQATACPHCGCPLTSSAQANAPALASPPAAAQPTTAPASPKQPEKVFAGRLGVCFAIFVVLYIIGMFMPEPTMSESFKAGEKLGILEGIMAYNGGRMKASDDSLDAAARRVTAGMKFDTSESRDDWIRGYKVGYDIGWDRAKR
jgi:hypothetical protein